MPIITISRGSYSRGKEVAEKLAERLGYTCLSREILLEASEEFNIPEFKLARALHDPPSALDRFHHGRERFISYLSSALLQHAKKDNLVYHGLAGHFLLRGISHVFRIRIIADMEDRVADEMQREKLTADEARYLLQKDDEERRRWALKLYGVDIWDCRLYDIVLKINRLGVDDVVDLLVRTAQKPAFQATPESQAQIEDLALAARVKAVLAGSFHEIDVCADQGKVYLHFRTHAPGDADASKIRRQVEKMEGITELIFSSAAPARQQNHINPFHNIG